MSNKTVAICIPTTELGYTDFWTNLCLMFGFSLVHGVSASLAPMKSYNAVFSRNDAAKGILGSHFEYVLFVDSDICMPADALVRLLSHDKPIVGATYNMRVPPHTTLGHTLDGSLSLPYSGVCEMKRMPTGLLLVHRSVFEQTPFPWFNAPYLPDGSTMTEDYWFCDQAREKGFSIWCDLDLTKQVTHMTTTHIGYRPAEPLAAPLAVAAE